MVWKEEPSEIYWGELTEWSELMDVRSLSEAGRSWVGDWVWWEGCVPVVLIAGRMVLPWLEPARQPR